MRVAVLIGFALVIVGCGSSGSHGGGVTRAAEKCADLFVRTAKPVSDANRAEIRHYVLATYCERFARNGWVYRDGALSIDAQRWLDRGTRKSCGTASPGGKSVTVPCSALPKEEPQVIDCAMLHRVRRSEVQAYLRGRESHVRCDDGTRLRALGVP